VQKIHGIEVDGDGLDAREVAGIPAQRAPAVERAATTEATQMAAADEWLRDFGEHRCPRQFALLP
jgi:hypothetical protein